MRIFWGLLLVVLGFLILGGNLDWFDFDLGHFLRHYWPVILIVIGAAEIIRHYRKKSDDAEWSDFIGRKFSKTFGDVHLKPSTMDPGGLRVDQGAGDIVIDLTNTNLNSGENRVECSLGMGDLRVIIPGNVPLAAECSIGVGDIHIFEKRADGFGQKLSHQDADYPNADKKIHLVTRVGLGDVRVTRG